MSFNPPNQIERDAVARLKERIKNDTNFQPPTTNALTDTAYLRFYRGSKGNEEESFHYLVKFLEWRLENDIDHIEQKKDLFQKELNANKFVVGDWDKSGRPTIFIYARRHDKNHRDLEEMKLLIIYTLEETLKKAHPEEERIVLCFDMEKFAYKNMDYDLVKMLIKILQYNYPDTLEKILVINSPIIFKACWGIIKPWLDPVTVKKVEFIKKKKMTDYFPKENIPKDL